jgi:glycosyltransferase involved in cell wall biosynthesis
LAVVGNSEWTTEQARQSFLKDAKVIDRIYNWINLDVFYPCVRETNEKFTILSVAQGWSEKKGLSIFIRLAEYFSDCKVVLVGKIETEIKLPDNVSVVGIISSSEELAKYYNNADVFVNTSIQETFGKVSAEALACGTPIVVNNATANPELVGEGCGCVVKNNDIESYYAAIGEIRRLGKVNYSDKCVQFARANFDMKKNIFEYKKLYNSIIEKF